MKKKKLIRITTADISLNSLIKGQLRFLNQYFDVVALSNDTGKLKAVGEREGVRVIEVPMHREISLKSDILCLWKLYGIFKKEKPDIIHANTPKGSLLAMVAGWLAGVKHRLYTVTGLRYQGASGLLRIILMNMERISCFFATKVIPEGNGVKKALLHDHITGKSLEVILNGNINGIDVEYFDPSIYTIDQRTVKYTGGRDQIRQDLGFSDKDFVFILIARMVRDKGINELAEVMRRLVGLAADLPRQPKLLIVGEKEVQSGGHITMDAQRFLSDSAAVFYAGHQKDVRPYLIAADALVFPSYREGFPNVPMEAGAMELPCIVTNINGCNEIIIDGENGVIIPAPLDCDGHLIQFASDDPQADDFSSPTAKALYQSMCDFIKNADNTNRIAANSRRLIQERYEQRDVWEALRQMYAEL